MSDDVDPDGGGRVGRSGEAESDGETGGNGGTNEQNAEHREKSFRGISERLAAHYLENLGGERVADDAVAGDGWRATLDSETVSVGPTMELTEVIVAFEGEPAVLDELIERFSRKAMRAGG